MNKITKILGLALAAIGGAAPASALEMTLATGMLQNNKAALESTSDNSLILKGEAASADLTTLRKLSGSVKRVDMSQLTLSDAIIPGCMLFGTEVESVTLPAGVTEIEAMAFAGTKLKSVKIPSGVTKIGDNAFINVTTLQSAEFPAAALTGKGIFRNCSSLATVTSTGDRSILPASTFEGCSALTHNPVSGVIQIEASAFRNSGLTTIDLNGVTKVGDYALAENPALATLTFSAAPVAYGEGVFFGNAALSDLPQWAGSLPGLYGAGTKTPNLLKITGQTVGAAAYANARGASEIEFQADVTEIKADAFRNMKTLKKVRVQTLGNNIPTLDHYAFSGLENDEDNYDIILYVQDDYLEDWSNHAEWGRFDVRKFSTSAVQMGADSQISISMQGRTLSVKSNAIINHMNVSTVSGILLYAGYPDSDTFTMDITVPGTIVVKVVAGGSAKVVKLQ